MSYIQGNTVQNGASSSTTVAVTLAAPVGVGNSILISGGIGGSDGTETVSLQDDKGNVYTTRPLVRDVPDTYTWWQGYFINATNSPQTITATINNTRTHLTIMADEFSSVGVFDQGTIQDQVAPGNATDVVTSGNVTTTANGELIYATCVSVFGENPVAGTGFTTDQATVSASFISEHKVQTSAGTVAGTFTPTTGTNDFITGVMTFKVPDLLQSQIWM